jgi:hypothetical protein
MNPERENTKPPLGIKPRYIWLHERRRELFDAMERYYINDMIIPLVWVNEHNNILRELGKG